MGSRALMRAQLYTLIEGLPKSMLMYVTERQHMQHHMQLPFTLCLGLGVDETLPPRVRIMPNRPRKSRVRAKDEPQLSYRVSRVGYDVCCEKCGVIGHNGRTCKKRANPNQQQQAKKPSKRRN